MLKQEIFSLSFAFYLILECNKCSDELLCILCFMRISAFLFDPGRSFASIPFHRNAQLTIHYWLTTQASRSFAPEERYLPPLTSRRPHTTFGCGTTPLPAPELSNDGYLA